VSTVSITQGAVFVYQIYGAWIAGQYLAAHRPWEAWTVNANTALGLAGFAVLFGLFVRLLKQVRKGLAHLKALSQA
jgi:hypothetical protein